MTLDDGEFHKFSIGLFFRPYRIVSEKSVIDRHPIREGLVSAGLSDDSPEMFPHYPLEGFAGFERKILKISFLRSPLDRNRQSGPLFWELLSLQYPLEENRLFGQKALKLFLLSTPLTKVAVWSKESETFFSSHYPTDTWDRFGLKKMKKPPENFQRQ